MYRVYVNITIGKDRANKECIPIQKAEQREPFGSLNYISCKYFIFILHMEFVFMNMFTPEKLVMTSSDLITNICKGKISLFDSSGFDDASELII